MGPCGRRGGGAGRRSGRFGPNSEQGQHESHVYEHLSSISAQVKGRAQMPPKPPLQRHRAGPRHPLGRPDARCGPGLAVPSLVCGAIVQNLSEGSPCPRGTPSQFEKCSKLTGAIIRVVDRSRGVNVVVAQKIIRPVSAWHARNFTMNLVLRL